MDSADRVRPLSWSWLSPRRIDRARSQSRLVTHRRTPDSDLVRAHDRILSDRSASRNRRRVSGRETCALPPVPDRAPAPFVQIPFPLQWLPSPASLRFPCKRSCQPVRSRLAQIADQFVAPARNNGSHYSSQLEYTWQTHSGLTSKAGAPPGSRSVSSPVRASLRRLVSLAEPALLAGPRCSES